MTDDTKLSNELPLTYIVAPTEALPTRWAEFSAPSGWTFNLQKPVLSIENLMVLWGLEFMYDSSINRIGAPQSADRPETVGDYLDAEPITINDLIEEIMLACNAACIKVAPRVIKAAVNKILRRKRKERKKILYSHLTKPIETTDRLAAEKEFDRAAELFDMPRELAKTCLGHWIWQVKQKMLGRKPQHHMMLIIYSAEQGSGKTTFASSLVSPLKEFASADVLMSDFADRRSGDIFRFPVIRMEDLEQAAASIVPIIKSLITSSSINRRPLFTSHSVTLRQAATLIGTANRPIYELIDDDTGHRRFVMMPFKNGNVAKGGNEQIWKIVNELDYETLWLAVDAFAPSPIDPLLKELHDYQYSYRPLPKVHKWVRDLDLSSEEVRRITVRGGVRAEALRDLYVAQTGDQISNQKFSDEMLTCTKNALMPFSGKQRKEVGALYLLRPAFEVSNDAIAQVVSREIDQVQPKRPDDDSEGLSCATYPRDPSAPTGPSDLPGDAAMMLELSQEEAV